MTAPTIFLDEQLVDEVSSTLDLRVPNEEALAAVAGRLAAHRLAAPNEPFEAVIDVATGVGKTYVLAASIEYFAQLGVRNFAVVTHRNAILTKTIANFTPGHRKSIVDVMTIKPTVITIDDLESGAAQAAMSDDGEVKLFVLSIQSLLKPGTKLGRRAHDFHEALGDGLYNHLLSADDLTIFADEHHCYYGPSFSKAMRDLEPMALVGLTGTPHKKTPTGQIVYRYPLAEAIKDELVKTPVVVGRSDDLADDATKLRDGLTLLRAKQLAADAYAEQTGAPARNLLMLVVAESIDEAKDVEVILASDAMFDGAFIDKVLRVDSSQPDDALEALDRVEEPDSSVRVIVSVQMLQEGWDVATVAVIVSLRASVSDILTEQTLGRGLRLPWGRYTDIRLLNQLDVVAHERYEQVLKKAGVALAEHRVDWASWQQDQLRVAEDLAKAAASAEAAEAVRAQMQSVHRIGDRHDRTTPDPAVPFALEVAAMDRRTEDVTEEAEAVLRMMRPRADLGELRVPEVIVTAVRSNYTLAELAPGLVKQFRELGRTYASNPEEALRRMELAATVQEGEDGMSRTVITPRVAGDQVLAIEAHHPSAAEIAVQLQLAMQHSDVATGRKQDVQPAKMLAAAVVEGAGADVGVLGRYLDQVRGAIVRELSKAAADSTGHVQKTEDIRLRLVDWQRARSDVVMTDHHGEFNRRVAYGGWQCSLYDEVAFDVTPERTFATIVDSAAEVQLWARLRIGDLSVNWTGTGRHYNPDFVVAENPIQQADQLVRPCWVVEVKADRDLESEEVAAKHDAAVKWASRVNAEGVAVPDDWHVLLVSETNLVEAKGSWKRLKALARTDHS